MLGSKHSFTLNTVTHLAALFSKQNKLDVINFGIIRSSPSLYLKRLKFFLEQEIRFKELFILIDISDLHDEIKYNKNIFKNDKLNSCGSINPIKKNHNLKINSSPQKIKNLSFQIKRIVKENFKISYTISELIWWKVNFKKFSVPARPVQTGLVVSWKPFYVAQRSGRAVSLF